MTPSEQLEQGRASFERRAWADACARLSAADGASLLEPEDLERLATAAYLAGRDADSDDVWARAHQDFLSRGEVERAARCAFWLAYGLLNRGETARGGGWIARARRLLGDERHDCVEQGYLLLPTAMQRLGEGDTEGAYATFGRSAEIGDRFGDPNLVVLARHGQGRTLIRMGAITEGVALLDEAMVAIETGEMSPIVVGDVYCSVIAGCMEVFDLRRAREWTATLTRWCASQPDLVPYRGECLVRRAQIMQLHGAWQEAMHEAQEACARFAQPGQTAGGAAFYQRAELHRLRGEFDEAEEVYRQASRRGQKTQPGLAQLRLAQGQVNAAAAAIRRAVDEARDRRFRARLLPACVEILLAEGDIQAARVAADELAAITRALDAPYLRAVSAYATGSLLLAEGDARAALAALRPPGAARQQTEAPYEAARARVLIGCACRELGDEDTAAMEFDAARSVFEHLGAAPDLARVEALLRRGVRGATHGLTPREQEVLRQVAAGETNKAIATELFISERTVERHVSNIFAKLCVSSRAAATAYAYEHGLV